MTEHAFDLRNYIEHPEGCEARLIGLMLKHRVSAIAENIGALAIDLSPDDVQSISEAASQLQPAGERYPAAQMAMVGRSAW